MQRVVLLFQGSNYCKELPYSHKFSFVFRNFDIERYLVLLQNSIFLSYSFYHPFDPYTDFYVYHDCFCYFNTYITVVWTKLKPQIQSFKRLNHVYFLYSLSLQELFASQKVSAYICTLSEYMQVIPLRITEYISHAIITEFTEPASGHTMLYNNIILIMNMLQNIG